MSFKKLSSFVACALFALPAHAHLGHVGEIAGHGHWIGLGALLGAAALAAALRKPKRENLEEEEEAEEQVPEGEVA